MAFFEKDFLQFFKELRKNNDREWFLANKPRYISSVKEPFEKFVEATIETMKPVMPHLLITPKESIFRIYRDTRFSKDKTPFKEHVSAAIVPGGRKNMSQPGIYIQMNDVDVRIYSGTYGPEKDKLAAIRNKIASDPKAFQKLYKKKNFVESYGEIRGEKNKRLPKDLREAAEIEPLIFNKGFYYFVSLPADTVLNPNFPKLVLKYYKLAQPLNDFFHSAE